MSKLIGNELFMLGLGGKLNGVPAEKQSDKVEKEAMLKITKILAKEQQERNCQVAEEKINKLIDLRLNQLREYH